MSLIFNAIILRVTQYKERGDIILLFSEEHGLISAVVRTSKRAPTNWLEPFVVVRGKFKERKGALFQTEEIEGTRWFLGLREKPTALRTLRSLTKTLSKRIEEESPAPLLYKLLLKVIEELEEGRDADTVEGLFLVKLALHEGVLGQFTDPWIEKAALARSFSSIPTIPTNLLFTLNRLF